MKHHYALVFASLLPTSLASCADPAPASGPVVTANAGASSLSGSAGMAGSVTNGTSGASGSADGNGGSGAGAAPVGAAGTGGSNPGTAGSLGAGGASGASGGGGQPAASLVPEQGALFGAFVARTGVSSYGNIGPAETQLGRKLRINHRFFGWQDDWMAGVADDAAAGRVPLVSWEPRDASLDGIIAGSEDALIKSRASAAKASGAPIFMRWGHEMNGDWYTWGGANNGGESGGPQKYIDAWRHVHDVFVAAGASNVLWVWCFNVGSSPNEPWNDPAAYYPGPEYVDWVAFDGYNWGTSQSWSSWRSFKDFAAGAYQQSLGFNKPIMVPETGVTELGGDKPVWIKELQAVMKSDFPKIKALVYFDTIDELNKVDWTMNSSDNALQAFVGLAKDPYFNP